MTNPFTCLLDNVDKDRVTSDVGFSFFQFQISGMCLISSYSRPGVGSLRAGVKYIGFISTLLPLHKMPLILSYAIRLKCLQILVFGALYTILTSSETEHKFRNFPKLPM